MPPKHALFTNDCDLVLSQLVEQRPPLWDSSLPEYHNRERKQKLWEEVSEIMGQNVFTVDVLVRRFKNVRDTFSDTLRRENEFKKKCSGAGREDVFVSRWHLWGTLQYLRKTFATAPSFSNINMGASASSSSSSLSGSIEDGVFSMDGHGFRQVLVSEDSMDTDFHSSAINISRTNPSSVATSPSCSTSASSPQLSSPLQRHLSISSPQLTSPPFKSPNTFFNKRGVKRSSDVLLEKVISKMDQELNKPLPPPPQPKARDDLDAFLEFIGSRMRRYSPQDQKSCENDILASVMKYDFA